MRFCYLMVMLVLPAIVQAGDYVLINGEIPPTIVAKSISSKLKVDTVAVNGTQLMIYETVRAAGTRTPIHKHPSSGVTCVLKGQMTLFLEGANPKTVGPGECYFMPGGLPMAGANEGNTDTVMLDIFATAPGASVWEVIEQEHVQLQHQFDGGGHTH